MSPRWRLLDWDQPVVTDRLMSWSRDLGYGSHGERAVFVGPGVGSAPAPFTWYLAEGATHSGFELFYLLQNPGAGAAQARVRYLQPSGAPLEKTYTIAPASRFTIWVDEEEIPAGSGLRALADAEAVSATLTSDVPIVAERAMWWPGPTSATWTEAHASVGATTTSLRWAAAAGRVLESPRREDTYYLVANPTPVAATVRATVFFADGSAPVSRDFAVGASSRLSLDMRSRFPETIGRTFGIVIESLGDSPAPVVVEWAVYNDALGVQWAAEANALATPLK